VQAGQASRPGRTRVTDQAVAPAATDAPLSGPARTTATLPASTGPDTPPPTRRRWWPKLAAALLLLGGGAGKATLVKSMPQFGLLFMLVFLPMQMLSGGNTPLDSEPRILQIIMQGVASTHFVSFAEAILFRGTRRHAGRGCGWNGAGPARRRYAPGLARHAGRA